MNDKIGLLLSSLAGSVVMAVTSILSHVDWRFAVYSLIANLSIVCAGGLVMARWSWPRPLT